MSIELPHRKVLILAAICGSVVLIALSYKLVEKRNEAVYNSSVTAVAGESEENSLADKRLLDALDQARQEELEALASSTNPFTPDPKDSVSDRFAKDIFAAYVKYQQAGGNISDSELSNEAISNINTDFLPKPKYNLADLRIIVPKNKDEIKVYGNLFAKEYVDVISKIQKRPDLYNSKVSDLTPIYKEIADRLIKIPTPNQVAPLHLELVNSMAIMGDSLVLIDTQSKDPVKALLGLRMVRDAVPVQNDMFTKISYFFQQNDILFSDNEYGVIWNPPKSTQVKPTAETKTSTSTVN